MTKPTPHTPEAIQERAALSALGALEPDEQRELEAHLAAGCESCRRELDACQEVAVELATAAASAPPPSLRTRLLARIAGAQGLAVTPVIEQPGFRFVRSEGIEWQRVATDIEVKRLALDRERGQMTQVIRMAPGARLKVHRHLGSEESYILAGELIVGGVRMGAGDYCLARPDSVHDDVWTEIGCTFIAVSSLQDEYQT